jgi:hypothetical protein
MFAAVARENRAVEAVRSELLRLVPSADLNMLLVGDDLSFFFDLEGLPYNVVVSESFRRGHENFREITKQIWPALLKSVTRRITITPNGVAERA